MKTRIAASIACALMFLATSRAATASNPDGVTLRDFQLTGDLSNDCAVFTLTAIAHVESRAGGSLDILSGRVALTDLADRAKWRIRAHANSLALDFDRGGDYPIELKFLAAVGHRDDWNGVEFQVAPGVLQKILLRGLPADTQFDFPGAARPELSAAGFVTCVPSDGAIKLWWRQASRETEGRLFYSAEMLSQITVSPGLMRQTALLDFKIMQGQLNQVALLVHGIGEVTRVTGNSVLAWNVEHSTNSTDRRLVVQLNAPQKDQFAFQVQMQTPLGAFPQSVDAVQLRPADATRFAGCFRIVNEGAVRLEVAQAGGLSQISPDQFPETDAIKALLRDAGSQRFAYRFSSADFSLRIQADQILPELGVSEVLAYHLGESELAIDAEIELDIRDAPLRELLLRVPKGYAVAQLNAAGMADYFLREPADQPDSELRLVYGEPATGRQVVQLRLERNQALGADTWALPRVEVNGAKSVRGHLGVSADAGFRLTAGRTQGLTEIATAFFPRKLDGIQTAFRLSDPAWAATLHVERLPQSIQADALHLFSVGEGIAYGSSVINYVVSGAPVSTLRVELSDEYFNVEFTGRDIRNWQKTDNGYVVQLHTPVAGAYTLLATYERPFKAGGETLAFTGAQPLDAQTEQGLAIVISSYQFEVKPAEISPGLLTLEPAEVPSEYRLFFDAPVLAAYRYTARPFNLKLALNPLKQGESLSQVVDRASFTTHVSKEGQVLTDVRYFIKNRGNPYLKLTFPADTRLWEASVNGVSVVPVLDGDANLIPLPQRADPNAVLTLDLKLASRPADSGHLTVTAPAVAAPVMLAQWTLEPDAGQRLLYRHGSLTPLATAPDASGFAQLGHLLRGDNAERAIFLLAAMAVLVGVSVVAWRWTGREGVFRFSARHLCGTALGLVALAAALVALLNFGALCGHIDPSGPSDLTFLAPVQQAGASLSVEIANVPEKPSPLAWLAFAWPAFVALALWAYAGLRSDTTAKSAAWIAAWTCAAWAALRWPNGATAFLFVLTAFVLLHLVIPALRQLARLPARPHTEPPPTTEGSGAPAAAALLLGGLLWFACGHIVSAAQPPVPESVTQQIRVEDHFASADAKIRWRATKGEELPLLEDSAVLTGLNYPTRNLKLIQVPARSGAAERLLALQSGVFDITAQYQLQVITNDSGEGFVLPTRFGLVNQVTLTLRNRDVDVQSPQAVSVQRSASGSNTVARLVLSPAANPWIAWKPRSRDVSREKPVFYAEINQLYVPSAGAIDGAHYVVIRPAQGELAELVFDVPARATITDVLDPAASRGSASLISLWRFDPDARKLRVNLSPAQSRSFALLIRSQIATGPLPFEQSVGLIGVENAAEQVGLLGIATGNEVQLDTVTADKLSPLNLEDFPATLTQSLQSEIPGLTVRRAFRYADSSATASLQSSAVEPDVRVETQNTLSLGEDRTVLAANATVDITRAGIFSLSFVLPATLDVESVSGPALSHWTESKSDSSLGRDGALRSPSEPNTSALLGRDGAPRRPSEPSLGVESNSASVRVITLHLLGKTEGRQEFALTLAGPGLKTARAWAVPEVVFREAAKQRGTLVVVPEQGMRLQVATREGVTQLDPQQSGIRQAGVLAFRVLQTPCTLALDIEQVDPWIQVTSLQHATVNEAQVKVAANLQYQIENTGLKAFRVWLPVNAESVRFKGDQVSDFLALSGAITNGWQEWEIRLHRRVIGQYMLQASYQNVLPEQAKQTVLRGVQAADVNLQRGFVTLESSGRLQVRVEALPEALQPAEWQAIPRALQQDLSTASANFAWRLVDPAFQLPLLLDRHEAAKLLPARVQSIALTSVVSDDGEMLTHVRLEIQPGDKRLLNLTLPEGATFWFAFVNQNGVWPWRDQDRILIPLDQPSQKGQAVPVEFFYSGRTGAAAGRKLDLALLAPKFDLPLENITWRVSVDQRWQLRHWAGSLQFQQQQLLAGLDTVDPGRYLQTEADAQRDKTKQAEDMLNMGNSLLEQGDPRQARRAFAAAYGLSQGDDAFNEDARVQLNNVKLQQAVVGLSVRQAEAAGDAAAPAARLKDIGGRQDINYTQQDAKTIIDSNTTEENAALMRLAERLIQQQDAAVSSPAAIRASLPEQGRVFTFQRAVVVDPWADLRISLNVATPRTASLLARAAVLACTLLALAALAWAARPLTTAAPRRAVTWQPGA